MKNLSTVIDLDLNDLHNDENLFADLFEIDLDDLLEEGGEERSREALRKWEEENRG